MVHDIASTCIAKKLWKTKMVWLSNAAASSGAFLWKGWVGTPAPRCEGGSGWQKKFRGSSQPIRSHDFQILTNRKPQFKFLEGLGWHRPAGHCMKQQAVSGQVVPASTTGTGRWLRKQNLFSLLCKNMIHCCEWFTGLPLSCMQILCLWQQ